MTMHPQPPADAGASTPEPQPPTPDSGLPTTFARLAEVAERIEATRGRNAMADLAGACLRSLAPAEIAPGARMLIGRIFAESDPRTLDVSWAAVWRTVRQLIAAPTEAVDAVFAEQVDGGSVVKALLERHRAAPVANPPLGLVEVYERLELVAAEAGAGSAARRDAAVRSLFERATPTEAKHLAKLLMREMRHGLSEGVLLDALARATGVPRARVARANQLAGDIGAVAHTLLTEGESGLARLGVTLYRPLKPMLAESAETAAEAWQMHDGRTALEYKLDGARVQIHVGPAGVRIFSRHLSDVTGSLPDIVAAVASAFGTPVGGLILEGEVMALDAAGRPRPFQTLMRRFLRERDVEATMRAVPATLYLFDLLWADGEPLLDQPYEARWARLADLTPRPPLPLGEGEDVGSTGAGAARSLPPAPAGAGAGSAGAPAASVAPTPPSASAAADAGSATTSPASPPSPPLPAAEGRGDLLPPLSLGEGRGEGAIRLVPRCRPADAAEAEAFYARAGAEGHEGLVAKRPDSPYTPGRRGGAWLKIKRATTLDLVIVAADWGYGRRHGWLSNYHLAVRDPASGRYLDVGKTFKGLTDAELAEMTERLLALKRHQRGATVYVEPRLVVEVLFNEILDSPRYASELALRHARIVRFRFDKPPEAADTIDTLRALYAAQRGTDAADAAEAGADAPP